ncbi:hypothetical protein Cde04nite_34170 [Cellulomonas denverensis]|nr:hypothetical protein Cde04nite_34170 [Cellulomonas denverensis]
MTGCDWCDEIGPDETPWLAQRHEAHRAFHDFGRAIVDALTPVVRWLDRKLTRGAA